MAMGTLGNYYDYLYHKDNSANESTILDAASLINSILRCHEYILDEPGLPFPPAELISLLANSHVTESREYILNVTEIYLGRSAEYCCFLLENTNISSILLSCLSYKNKAQIYEMFLVLVRTLREHKNIPEVCMVGAIQNLAVKFTSECDK